MTLSPMHWPGRGAVGPPVTRRHMVPVEGKKAVRGSVAFRMLTPQDLEVPLILENRLIFSAPLFIPTESTE